MRVEEGVVEKGQEASTNENHGKEGQLKKVTETRSKTARAREKEGGR